MLGSWLGFRSWTLSPVLDFENERLVAHFLFFIFGAACYQRNVFAKLPEKKVLYNIATQVRAFIDGDDAGAYSGISADSVALSATDISLS